MEKKNIKTKKRKYTRKKNYNIKPNNYLIVFIVLFIVLGILAFNYRTHSSLSLPSSMKEIKIDEGKVINEETEEIKRLTSYLNPGDSETYKIYQSMYVNASISIDDLNDETLLYLAYKNIEKNTDLTKYNRYITCDIASNIGIENKFYQCVYGGLQSTTSYQINNYITKEILSDTIREMFNINISEYTNFYTNKDDLCIYKDNNYICSNNNISNNDNYTKHFVKAFLYQNKLEIIEEYSYNKDGLKYKGFMGNELGSQLYISTFNKVNNNYYWSETNVYNEN